MGTEKQALILIVLFSFVGCAGGHAVMTKEEADFRKYAMSICIGSSFSEEVIKLDANKSANVYQGNVELDAYEELRRLQVTWRVDDFKSKSGGRVSIARCVEFSGSREVGSIFAKFDPCGSEASWVETEEYVSQCGANPDK